MEILRFVGTFFSWLSRLRMGWLGIPCLFVFLLFLGGCDLLSGYSGKEHRLTPVDVYSGAEHLSWLDSKMVVPMIKLLDWLHSQVGSYWLAILLIPTVFRTILAPIVWRQNITQIRMRKLQPELQRIRAKYKGDPARQHQAYSDYLAMHGLSPFSSMTGCLPMLLQMPLFLGLFQATSRYTALEGSGFLFWEDISKHDPYYVFPFVAALMTLGVQLASFAIHGKNAMGTQFQAVMKGAMFIGPVFIFVFATKFPVASGLYFCASNLVSLVQSTSFLLFRVRPAQRKEVR